MPAISRRDLSFYLEGRSERRRVKDLDKKRVVARILDGEGDDVVDVRELIAEACRGAISPSARLKSRWLDEHAQQIRDLGSTEESAWSAWTQGCADELAVTVEPRIVDALCDEDDEDDSDEDDEDEDEEEVDDGDDE